MTKPGAGLDMQRLGSYATSRGVGLRVWVPWQPFCAQFDEALAQFEQWGVRGMMVAFVDRDDQRMIRMQKMLRPAARHHLPLQLHGAAKPAGLVRTYPNELAREAALNHENNKWEPTMLPDYGLNMPFTRLLAGLTTYPWVASKR